LDFIIRPQIFFRGEVCVADVNQQSARVGLI